jgi:hypothetical protein
MSEREISDRQKSEFRPRDRWLLFAFACGPLSVLLQESISYALVPTACSQNSKLMLHVSTATFVAITLLNALLTYRFYGAFEEKERALWTQRTRWIALVAIVLSIGAAMFILAMEIPNVILRSCD